LDTVDKKNLLYRDLPELRKDLGYKWEPTTVGEAIERLKTFLENNDAIAFKVDTYASDDCVYRTYTIQLPRVSVADIQTEVIRTVSSERNITLQFHRDGNGHFIILGA